MVEQTYNLDAIFKSLSDPTRRDILARIRERNISITRLAEHYAISFAGVAKHLEVLERAGLIFKRQHGKERIVAVEPQALRAASQYLMGYQELWEQRLDSLDAFVAVTNPKGRDHGTN